MADQKSDSKTNPTLQEKVSRWLHEEGFPLEFSTADAFRQAGFRVLQGEYTQPESDEPRRELDVVAHASRSLGKEHLLRVEFVVECKWSGDKPWVLFGAQGGMTVAACASQAIGSQLGEALLWKEAGHKDLAALSLFHSEGMNLAFGGKQAFSRTKDQVFDAIRSVTAGARILADEYDSRTEQVLEADRLPEPAVAVFPVIVVDGHLFRTSQSDEGVDVEEVSSARIHWRGSDRHRFHATLDIVRADQVEIFAKDRLADADALLEVMSTGLEELRACHAKGRLDQLPVTSGARGVRGNPQLISSLLRRQQSEQSKELTEKRSSGNH
jgi:hypothetical protein